MENEEKRDGWGFILLTRNTLLHQGTLLKNNI
jgi:hypothetical protein